MQDRIDHGKPMDRAFVLPRTKKNWAVKMAWIGLYDRTNPSSGLLTNFPDAAQIPLLSKGTFRCEFGLSPDSHTPRRLLHLERSEGWLRRFTVFLNADFSLSVEIQQGNSRSYGRLSAPQIDDPSHFRLSISWDGPQRHAVLTLENLGQSIIHQTPLSQAVPMPLGDIAEILDLGPGVGLDRDVRWFAFSDDVEPIGPQASIGAGALVQTAEGNCLIENLRLGDLVQTKENGLQPVRWILRQDVPACGLSQPFMLRAPYFGLSAPIIVAGAQRVMISGIDTQYEFGRDAVMVEARDITSHPATVVADSAPTITYYQILLDEHDCINLSGVWSDSLFVGQLARFPEITATTGLANMPADLLPVHRRRAYPTLNALESQVLLSRLIA